MFAFNYWWLAVPLGMALFVYFLAAYSRWEIKSGQVVQPIAECDRAKQVVEVRNMIVNVRWPIN